jgi:hypothetical protein
MSNPQHGKVITTLSYYEGEVASTKEEIEVSLFSTKDTILKDLIESLAVLNSGETHKLELCIVKDIKGRYRIVKKWSID